MNSTWIRILPFCLAVAVLSSCATSGLTPSTSPPAAARMGLRPELRVFYDALEGHGDWILIEPFGWVFRPDVNFSAWRPYQTGFWTWNDWYGWVWASEEPFGWATYHYGRWYYDSYQGWVWLPASEWGPAWVAWASNGDYVGWAPLPPPGSGSISSGFPQGTPSLSGWSFVRLAQLPGADLKSRLVEGDRARKLLSDARPLLRMAERDGHLVNLGPAVELVERATGMTVPRTEIVDPLAPGGGAAAGSTAARAKPRAAPLRTDEAQRMPELARRAGEQAARRAAELSSGSPQRAPRSVELPQVRFGNRLRSGPARGRATREAAEADSTRERE